MRTTSVQLDAEQHLHVCVLPGCVHVWMHKLLGVCDREAMCGCCNWLWGRVQITETSEEGEGVVRIRVSEMVVGDVVLRFVNKDTGESKPEGATKPEAIMRQLSTRPGQASPLPSPPPLPPNTHSLPTCFNRSGYLGPYSYARWWPCDCSAPATLNHM